MEQHEYDAGGGEDAGQLSLNSLPTPANSWEHYDLGRWLMRHGKLVDAEQQFATAVDLKPDEFWPHFQQMRCAYQLRHFDEALTAASVCIALAPQYAQCSYNHALCEQSLGHDQEALADFGRALQLDSSFGAAALARGILLGKAHRFAEAQSDLELASKCGAVQRGVLSNGMSKSAGTRPRPREFLAAKVAGRGSPSFRGAGAKERAVSEIGCGGRQVNWTGSGMNS